MVIVKGRQNFLLTIVVVVVYAFLLTTGIDGLRLDINPEKCTATIEDSVHLTCVPDSLNIDLVSDITFFKIYRNDEKEPIAFFSHCADVTYGTGMEEHFQAVGHIGKDLRNSYLNVTLKNPGSKDTGVYTCVMFYVDTSGDLKEEVTSGNLIVEKMDVKALETLLSGLRTEIVSLKTNVKNQINKVNKLQRQASQLDVMSKNQSQQINRLTITVSANVAFSATIKNQIVPKTGQPVVFDTIIMQIGQEYDPRTGIFTTVQHGMYVFSLTVMGAPNCDFRVRLQVNYGLELGVTYTNSQNRWGQSTVSPVTELRPGDTVIAKAGSSCKMYAGNRTLFSGYMLHALF